MNKKTSSLNVRISSELKQRIVQEAQKLGMTVTEYVEFILNKTSNIETESLLSDSFMDKLGSVWENNSVLAEIKELSNQNLQRNGEVLKNIGVTQEAQINLKDVDLRHKLNELLEIMKHEKIRYEKDGESFIGHAKTPNDVLSMIIHNYHSLITKSLN